jgi:hypothetical protein
MPDLDGLLFLLILELLQVDVHLPRVFFEFKDFVFLLLLFAHAVLVCGVAALLLAAALVVQATDQG